MASFRCYDSSDIIAILIMTNFPLYLIQLWWQFFPDACLWRRSLCSNLAGIDSEKLYGATFICQYCLFCCLALVSFRLFCKNLGNLQEFFRQMDYRPPGKKLPVRLCLEDLIEREDESDKQHKENQDQNLKRKEDRLQAKDIRTKSLERLGETQKRKGEDSNLQTKAKKKRATGGDAVVFLR